MAGLSLAGATPAPADIELGLWIGLAFTGTLAIAILGLAIGFKLLRWRGVLDGTVQPEPMEAPIRWGLFGIALLAFFFAQFVVVFVMVGWLGGFDAMQEKLQDTKIVLLATVAPWLITIPIAAVAGVFLPKNPWKRLGWKAIGFAHGALATPMIIPVVFAVTMGTQLVRFYTGADLDEAHPLIAGLSDDPWLIVTMFVGAGLIVPIAEEIAFRGLLQGALGTSLARLADPMKEVSMRWLSILITSLVFAVIHPMFSWPSIFVLSILMGYAYERSGSLWTPIVIHVAFNLFNLTLATLAILFAPGA